MKLRYLILILAGLATGASAQLLVNIIDQETNRRDNFKHDKEKFYQAENVRYNLEIKDGTAPITIPSTALPVWQVWTLADPTNVFVETTGTLVSTSDKVRMMLSPTESNFATGTYESIVRLIDSASGTNIGVGARGKMEVLFNVEAVTTNQVAAQPVR